MTSPLTAPMTVLEQEQTARVIGILDAAALSVGLPSYSRLNTDLILERLRFPELARERALGLAQAEIRRLRLGHVMAATDLRALRQHVSCGRRPEALSLIDLLIRDAEAGAVNAPLRPLPADVPDLEQARVRRGGSL